MSPRSSSSTSSLLKLSTGLLGLAIFIAALGFDHGAVPAMGPLLNPFQGLWKHPASFWESPATRLDLSGLKAPVQIVVDKNQIKHLFAENDEDLYFAQGFVIASERLWQMEFIARVASGRLSEIMGPRTLEYDRYFTKLGLPAAAKESATMMMNDAVTSMPLRSYAAGVNAYIRSLNDQTKPLEYKILNLKPEEWTPEKAAHLLKYMAFDLTGYNRELALSRSRSRLSKDDFDSLFPLKPDGIEPIVPKGTKFNFEERTVTRPKDEFLPDLAAIDKPAQDVPKPDPSNGSNNWAVTGKKSATGKPILSNDVHLGYNLPALWYELQLHSPTQNVYGATLPGSPGVIIGFNPKVAWAVTNASSDVMDWYQLRFRDDHRSEYLFEGSWRPVVSREMKITVRGAPDVPLLLRQTHLGPIVFEQDETPLNAAYPRGLAMRWAALDASNELRSFLLLNRAKSTSACREAIETFQTPAQNFLCADQSNDVGLWHMGRFPVRWPGQGRLLSDGSSVAYEWRSYLPRSEVPSIRNPARGFLSSANQAPVDELYPHYLGSRYPSPFRALRINEVLREKKLFSAEDLVSLQGDTLSTFAREALSLLLKAIHPETLSAREKEAVEELQAWDFRYDSKSGAAALFEEWIEDFETRLWRPHFPDRSTFEYPSLTCMIELMKDEPDSKWFNDPETPASEKFPDVALTSFRTAFANAEKKFGTFAKGKWKWTDEQMTVFDHVSKIPGLGDRPFAAPGVAESVFANKGRQGPVWKMVVSLGSKPRAWTVYPGGQSGDPVSRHYNDFLSDWAKNQLKEVVYLDSADDVHPAKLKTVTMKPQAEAQ